MAGRPWKTTPPPKGRKVKPVRLRYRNKEGGCRGVGDFFWSERENAWVEAVPGPDGLALYKDDGWEVLGWR